MQAYLWLLECSVGIIGYYELLKIRWCLTINSIQGEEDDFKVYCEFYRGPMQRRQQRRYMISFLVPPSDRTAGILNHLESFQ